MVLKYLVPLLLVAATVLATSEDQVLSNPTQVTGGQCNSTGPCVEGSVLTLTGTGFTAGASITIGRDATEKDAITCPEAVVSTDGTTLTCTLNVTSGTATGEYPITVKVDSEPPSISGGNIVLGTFPQQDIAGWNNHQLATAGHNVVGRPTSMLSTGEELLIFGTFDTGKSYQVLFYNVDNEAIDGNGGKTPTCKSVEVAAHTLTCIIQVDSGVMGMWGFLVQEGNDGYLPGSTTLKSIAVRPPLPKVTNASGDCAQDSSKCITGATLTFTGSNFNARKPEYNAITIGDGSVTCEPTAVTAGELTCTLTVPAASATVLFTDISITTQICVEHRMQTTASNIGFLTTAPFFPIAAAGWTPSDFATDGSRVIGQSSNEPSSGDEFVVYGSFNTTKAYSVLFYYGDGAGEVLAGNGGKAPSCKEISSVTSRELTCIIQVDSGVMGMWGFLVREEEDTFLPGSTTLFKIAVNPPLPKVTNASGDCAQNSSKCITGATLTFTGSNFNARKPEYNVITIGDGSVTCEPTAVTADELTCTLTVPAVVNTPGFLKISIQVMLCMHSMRSPASDLGFLLIGEGHDGKGWVPSDENVAISAIAPQTVGAGSELTFVGSFADSGLVHTVQLQAVDSSVTATPTCEVTAVTVTTVTCKYTATRGVYGTWRPNLLAAGVAVSKEESLANFTVTLDPLPPSVTSVAGPCAEDASKCVEGAELVFHGEGFSTDAAQHRFVIESADGSGNCTIKSASSNTLACLLTPPKRVANRTTTAAYPMALHTAVAADKWMAATTYAGSLVQTTEGYKVPGVIMGDTAPILPMASATVSRGNKAAVACAVIFGLVTLVFIVATALVFLRYRCVKRSVLHSNFDNNTLNVEQSMHSIYTDSGPSNTTKRYEA